MSKNKSLRNIDVQDIKTKLTKAKAKLKSQEIINLKTKVKEIVDELKK